MISKTKHFLRKLYIFVKAVDFQKFERSMEVLVDLVLEISSILLKKAVLSFVGRQASKR